MGHQQARARLLLGEAQAADPAEEVARGPMEALMVKTAVALSSAVVFRLLQHRFPLVTSGFLFLAAAEREQVGQVGQVVMREVMADRERPDLLLPATAAAEAEAAPRL
jgi:hypothetical protein